MSAIKGTEKTSPFRESNAKFTTHRSDLEAKTCFKMLFNSEIPSTIFYLNLYVKGILLIWNFCLFVTLC